MSDSFHQTENVTDNLISENTEIQLPPECKVIFFNDDFTTMDFVVNILISIFNKSHQEANALMLSVHENGSALIGQYTYDIAVSRVALTRNLAKKNGFPLRVEIE